MRLFNARASAALRLCLLLSVVLWIASCTSPAAPGKEGSQPAAKQGETSVPKEAGALKQVKKITMSYAFNGAAAPAWVTKEAGIFQKYGLDVELMSFGSGAPLVTAMVAGDPPIGVTSAGTVAPAVVQGAELMIIVGYQPQSSYVLMAKPEIKTMADLKGKSINITRRGASPDFLLRRILPRYNLEPDKDVAILPLGGEPEIIGAMASGQVQSALIMAPNNILAKKAGFSQLLEVASLGMPYQASIIVANRKWLKDNEDVAQAVAYAITEGIHRYKTDKPFSMKVINQYMNLSDPEIQDETYQYYMKITAETPYANLEGIQGILDEVAATEPKAKSVKPADFVDQKYVKQVEDSGLIKRLYGK